MAFQERYFNELPIKKKVAMVVPYLQAAELVATPPACETAPLVTQILEAAGDRLKIAGDILDYDDFFVADEALAYDDKAFEKRIGKPEEAMGLLKEFREQLAGAESFDAASLETLLKGWVETKQIKIGQIIHALRVAVTGKAAGFGMFETWQSSGKKSAWRGSTERASGPRNCPREGRVEHRSAGVARLRSFAVGLDLPQGEFGWVVIKTSLQHSRS